MIKRGMWHCCSMYRLLLFCVHIVEAVPTDDATFIEFVHFLNGEVLSADITVTHFGIREFV